jgi:sugar/nucleoside kinase (ribokinase family)
MENKFVPSYDTVFIGNYTKDTIVTPTGTRYVDGGGMNYAANAAVRMGMKTAVVTRLAKEDDRVVQALKASGIDCFVTYTPSSTLMKLDYPTLDPDIRTLSVTGTAGAITAAECASFITRAAVIGTSLRGEVNCDVIKSLHERGVIVAADMQGFVRVLRGQSLVYEPWEEMQATLTQVDILKSDAVEAAFLTGENDIFQAAKKYAAMGPREIVLTHKDGLLIYADGEMYEMGFYPSRLDGRSGRGDTCVGTYVAMRQSMEPYEAGIWAAAVTTLKMENLGVFNRPLSEVEALIQRKYRNGLNGGQHKVS